MSRSFLFQRLVGDRVHWRCTNLKGCTRTVLQYRDDFKYGLSDHNHQPTPGISQKHRVISEIKAQAVANVLKPVPTIVRELLKQQDPTLPEGSRPNPAYVVRNVDRLRQGIRPQEPKTCDFEVSFYICI